MLVGLVLNMLIDVAAVDVAVHLENGVEKVMTMRLVKLQRSHSTVGEMDHRSNMMLLCRRCCCCCCCRWVEMVVVQMHRIREGMLVAMA